MKKLSVIIVSYNGLDMLCECLDSIEKYNDIGENLEVIVSDNSPDNVVIDTIAQKYPYVRTIKNQNIGYGAANNRGEEIAEGEYILFLNPDTILKEPIFSFALKKFKDKDLALFGVQLVSPEGKKRASFFFIDRYGILAVFREKFARMTNCYKDGKMFICGADLFVRRESFIDAGRFDEKIFMYKEEPDLIRRIKLYATSKKTAFFRQKHIIHLEGGTQSNDTHKALNAAKRLFDSDVYYCRKWNINVKKVIRGRINYIRFKKVLFAFAFKRKSVKAQTELLQYYCDALKLLNEEKNAVTMH